MYEPNDRCPVHTDACAEHAIAALDAQAVVITVAKPAVDNPGYQLPSRIWGIMLASYATFFVFIAVATGGSGHARFAIVISMLYTAIYFGVARIGARQAGAENRSPLDEGRPLQTWTGPMDKASVYSQILVVPVCIAFFAIAIAVFSAWLL